LEIGILVMTNDEMNGMCFFTGEEAEKWRAYIKNFYHPKTKRQMIWYTVGKRFWHLRKVIEMGNKHLKTCST